MELTRLADRDNFRQVESEWQYEFTAYVLSNLGIPKNKLIDCLPENFNDFTVECRIKLKKLLQKYFVTIVDDLDHGLKFYLEVREGNKKDNVLVAEWKKCRFVYKVDMSALERSKRIYTEVVANVWTIFKDLND